MAPEKDISYVLRLWEEHPDWKIQQRLSVLTEFLQGDESNAQFAERVGFTHSTITRWKNQENNNFSADTFINLSKLLPYSPGELMEMLYGFKKPGEKLRKIRTATEILELAGELPEGEVIELISILLTGLNKFAKIKLLTREIERLGGIE